MYYTKLKAAASFQQKIIRKAFSLCQKAFTQVDTFPLVPNLGLSVRSPVAGLDSGLRRSEQASR
jgi:hypothetical protein